MLRRLRSFLLFVNVLQGFIGEILQSLVVELRGFVLVLKESQCCAIGIGLRIDFKACFIYFFVCQSLLQLCRVYREGSFLLGDPVVLATIFRHGNRNGQCLMYLPIKQIAFVKIYQRDPN